MAPSLLFIPLYAEFKQGVLAMLVQWLCSTLDEGLFTSTDDDGCCSQPCFQAIEPHCHLTGFKELWSCWSFADILTIMPN